MIPRSLRGRVALAAAVAIVLAVGLLGLAVEILVERQLRTSLDDALHTRAAAVARLSATAPGVLTVPGALEGLGGGEALLVQVVDRDGRLVARSSAIGARLLPLGPDARAAIDDGRTRYGELQLGDEHLRALTAPLADSGGPAAGGAVIVAASTAQLDENLEDVRRLVIAAAILAAVLGGLAALLLTRRALEPLPRLSRAAEAIGRTGDPERRLPVPATGDELTRLAGTLNDMLGALERAREAERRFVADASHELRTPLTALRGNAAYAARHGADAEVLAELERDADRLARLLDDLLVLAREDTAPPPRERVRLDELARRVAGNDPRVALEAPGPVTVVGDEAALERALVNLVENARVHGPAGGRIAVRAAVEGERAVLSVTDDGLGIAEGERALAFDRFWRGAGTSDRPGSGLGLAIVRGTAERHGGRIAIDGATVALDLPLAPPP